MPHDTYVVHTDIEVEGFQLTDATASGSRGHDDLVWVGYGGMDGRWLTPEKAMAVAAAITTVATANLVRRGHSAQP